MKANVKIFARNLEESAQEQINQLIESGVYDDCNIRIMPDAHSGKGCVIGFTSEYKDKIVPCVCGVDLNCLDKDTEILTQSGWIKISNYLNQDILVFDLSKEEARFENH